MNLQVWAIVGIMYMVVIITLSKVAKRGKEAETWTAVIRKIQVRNLKKFGKLEVLKDISIDISEGEVVVLLGPSGSGKSTFLRCVNQLETVTAGSIIVDGVDVTDKHTDINKVRENIGMVFQHFNLFPPYDGAEKITLAPVELKKLTQEQAEKKGMELLARVGLAEDRQAPYPNQLSGGQKQRVAIARASP